MNQTIVLIPHYNNPQGLINSIASINETEQIDVLIVDDGSNKFKINEADIKIVFKAKGTLTFIYGIENKGIEYTLNKGLDIIVGYQKYKFVARLDSGDLCLKNRFFIQEKFLIENPQIKLLGTNAKAIDLKGNFLYDLIRPEKHKEIQKKMFLNSMFIHPSVMFDISILNEIQGYPYHYSSAEDYAFFFEIVKKFETSNLQQFLLHYEINPNGISQTKRDEQIRNRIKIIRNNFYLGFWPILGILKNYILLIIPQKLVLTVKKHF